MGKRGFSLLFSDLVETPGGLFAVLDQAIDLLNPTDRQTIVLRFYRSLSHGELGRELRVSQNVARVRVQRALERLRRFLKKKGITASTALLSAGFLAQK